MIYIADYYPTLLSGASNDFLFSLECVSQAEVCSEVEEDTSGPVQWHLRSPEIARQLSELFNRVVVILPGIQPPKLLKVKDRVFHVTLTPEGELVWHRLEAIRP